MQNIRLLLRVWLIVCFLGLGWFSTPRNSASAAGTTYYVSTSGDDSNNGQSSTSAFRTIAKVNSLALQPGDRVSFRCGDTWRGEMLVITRSGTAANPITFGSYPDAACANKPVISGAQLVTGWTLHSGSVYVADLNAGVNAGKFPNGINQVFRGGARLGIGRWPDIDAGDGGYSAIDGQPAANQFTDNQLPAGDWNGATAHIKGMRWYILNRAVTGDTGSTLTLGATLDCWGGNCTGWGYWLDSHLNTLSRDGEWYYNPAQNKLYMYSASGNPGAEVVEASTILSGEGTSLGGIILGKNLQTHIAYVVIENFEVSKWFDNGITTPINLEKDENYELVLRNNLIKDVNRTGINLATWVWNAQANGNGPNGWRGGRKITVSGNLIIRANRMGIDSYARQSTIEDNTIADVGRIQFLGKSGMGCAMDGSGGGCTEDGDGIRIKVDQADYSGNSNVVQNNRLERIGYNGMDVFGYGNTFYRNVILQPCISKGDCGGLRSFGGGNLSTTPVHDLSIRENIVLDSIGNTDGAHSTYRSLFGFGLYIDHASRNVVAQDNIIAGSTAAGLLYQDSTGSSTGNLLFDNARANSWSGQVVVTGSGAQLSTFTGNTLLGKQANTWTMDVDSSANFGVSNDNGFYHVSRVAHIYVAADDKTLAQWRAASGKDSNSLERVAGVLSSAELFYNDTQNPSIITLPGPYQDLQGNAVARELILQPYTGRILVASGPADAYLWFVKSAPGWVAGGSMIEYRLQVSNLGGAAATNLTVRDTLPAGVTYVSGGTLQGGEVIWTQPSLGVGETVEFTLSVSAQPGVRVVRNLAYSAEAQGLAPVSGPVVVTIVEPEQVYLPRIGR
jgi:uncharacterized repeat protein (TIGR01451 family)